MNTTIQRVLTHNLEPSQKSLHTTHTSLTFNTDLTPIGMKNFMTKTNWSTKIFTIKNKPNDQIESDDLITDAHVSDALRYALIDLWTVNPHLPDTSALPNFQPRPQNLQRQTAVIDDQTLPQLQVTPDGLTRFLPLSTNLPLKMSVKCFVFQWISGS